MSCRNRVEVLNSNGKTLKEKGRFTKVIRYKRKMMTQRRKEITTSLVYWTKSFKGQWNIKIFGSNFGIFLYFREATASAAESAQEAVLFQYEAASVSVTVTSQVAQRPSCHGVNVRPSGRFRPLRGGLEVP
jgi:hypothetical protein